MHNQAFASRRRRARRALTVVATVAGLGAGSTATVAALATATSIAISSPVAAAPLEHGDVHFEFSETVENFCDVPGLTVLIEGVVDGKVLINRRGPDQLIHFMEFDRSHVVYTNLANGNAISEDAQVLQKDVRVVDNGDGTLTITILGPAGHIVAYGPDGEVIGRQAGVRRFQIVVDHGGTPTDPSDDVFLEAFGLRENGQFGDFCEVAVAVLA
jgi:hypothetical protein